MATIFDDIRAGLTQSKPEPTLPPLGAQEVGRIASVAATGKAREGGAAVAPLASNIGTEAVQAHAQAQKAQLAAQGQFQAEVFRNQEEANRQRLELNRKQLAQGRQLAFERLNSESKIKVDRLTNEAETQLQRIAQNFGLSKDNVFELFDESDQKLEDRADHAQIEQLAFLLGLQDRETVANLQEIGTLRRLDQSIAFTEETNKQLLGSNLNRFLADIGLKEELLKSSVDLNNRMFEVSLQDKARLLDIAADEQATKALIEGTTQLAGEGIKFGFDRANQRREDALFPGGNRELGTLDSSVPSPFTQPGEALA